MEKLKAGIFDGPQTRQLIRDPEFEKSMNEVKLEAWKAFVLVVKNFLGNNKAKKFAELVNDCFQKPGLQHKGPDVHMDRFPENLGSMSDEQGEIPLGPERDGDKASGSLGRSHDGWLLLEFEERPPCRWAFQEFEETEFQALKFEQWWHAIYVYLPLSMPIIQFTVIDVSIG